MIDKISHQESGDRGAFYIERDGKRIAEMTYSQQTAQRIVVDHTFVDTSLRGQGVARKLLDAAVSWARQRNCKVGATCSYVITQFARDPSLRDIAP
jgi:predicted GNAT family acetyltransferase